MARALRFQTGLPLQFWGDCVLAATRITNRLPSVVLKGKTPYELLHKKQPEYWHLKVFGCLAFAYNPSRTKDKFQPRGVPCVFIGYSPSQKGYRLHNLLTGVTFVSRDVKFYEAIFPYHIVQDSADKNREETGVTQDTWIDLGPENTTTIDQSESGTQEENTTAVDSNVRRSSREHRAPTWHNDYHVSANCVTKVTEAQVSSQFSCFMNTVGKIPDPKHFKEAARHSHWLQAMNEELDALESNNTWEVTDLPAGKTAIGCKWLYTTKYDPQRESTRYKSRLVILGNRQKYGVDFDQTFAPVAKLTTVRSLLAVAAIKGWYTHQMDVKNAFLHGKLEDVVYMKFPPGYKGVGFRFNTEFQGEHQDLSRFQNKVLRLLKTLYGLRQSPRLWFEKLSLALKSDGFKQSKADSTLFTKQEGSNFTAVLAYVDDLLITGNCMPAIDETKQFLNSQFKMKDLGELRYFLGIEVDRNDQGIFLSQKKYICDILDEYKMTQCKPLKLPMDTHVKLISTAGEPLSHPEEYQKLVGKLIYLTITRPDIAFTVHVLSQFMHSPTSAHFQAAKRVLRYLSGSKDQGILLASSSAAELQAYCDSDWAGCPNTRRSTTGYCIVLGKSPIAWKSKKQSVVARSTAEAEYRSLAMTVCEVLWVKQLLKDLGLTHLGSTTIFCDNKSALAIAANPVHHEKTKHVEIDCHFIREQAVEGNINPTYVPTTEQVADVFTKILTVGQHQILLNKLGVNVPNSQLERE